MQKKSMIAKKQFAKKARVAKRVSKEVPKAEQIKAPLVVSSYLRRAGGHA